MQFLKAYYDPNTDKIMNCEEGSFIWYHERRHQIQLKNKLIYRVYLWSPMVAVFFCQFAIYLWITTGETSVFVLPGLFLIPFSLLVLFMELDAWRYAIIKYMKYN